MKIIHNERLKQHTTIKVGGIAKNYYIPENIDELCGLAKNLSTYKVLSGGSNVLINDKAFFENVIYMGEACSDLEDMGDGKFYCGASVRIQKLIKNINEAGYGGIEELISVPGMIGGMLYMNASIGNDVIVLSDYLISVHALHNGVIETLKRDECGFGHRSSIFQNGEYIILGALFSFPHQDKQVSSDRINKRKKKCKEKLDYSGYNFGSLYKTCNYRVMARLAKLNIHSGGASLSSKTINWINNDGTASYRDIKKVIKTVSFFQRLFGTKPELEICVWENDK